MMKKLFTLLLSIALILSVVVSAAAEDMSLPDIGEEISGFVVKSITPMQPLAATGVLFEHEKTGAQLLYLASEDTNRSFSIAFRTPALDDKGKPHVFEHLTLGGSMKYPDANIFFPFYNQTYNTFVNALTAHGMTCFPLASMSEEQLMTMMDFYLSSVFQPLLYVEPRLVDREAWRYELADADQPLTIAGTVYSEMQGALNIATQAYYNSIFTLFKDGATAHVSGGVPEDIRTLTHDELLDFHTAYYHPSNALIMLYGKLDYERFMAYIDAQYLSGYERSDIDVEMGVIEPYTETLYAAYDAPVELGAQTENASYIHYAFGASGVSLEDFIRLDILQGVLAQESSPLMRTLRKELPNAVIQISIDIDMPVPIINFVASGVNEGDRDVFVKAVDDCIAELSENGIDPNDLDAILSANKLALLLTAEDADLGVNSSINNSYVWAYFDRVDYFNVFQETIENIDASSLKQALDEYLVNNTYRAVSVTRPAPGLAEENAAKLEAELAEIKAAMTPEEIDALVKRAAEFVEWSKEAPSEELMKQLLVVTPDTLPEELVHYDVNDDMENGVRYITSEAQVAGLARVKLMLDASAIPIDKLQDVEMFLNLLGQLDTEKYTKEELSALLVRYLNGFSGKLQALNRYGEGIAPLFATDMSWTALREDMPQSVALLRELLFNTELTDTAAIRDYISRGISSFAQNLDASIRNIQRQRLRATYDVAVAYNSYLTNYDFYGYSKELLALDDEQLIRRLEAARDIVLDRYNAIVICAGDAETIGDARAEMAALLSELPETRRESVDYSELLLDITREALVVNSTVQVNMIGCAADEYSGAETPLVAMINDLYMLPKLRNAMGAYGAYAALNAFEHLLYTNRDPNLADTYAVFEGLPEYLRTADITQKMIDTYIVGSYSNMSSRLGVLGGAMQAANNYLSGLTEEMRLERMRNAKAVTVEDVRAMAERIQYLVDNGVRSTSATASTIEANIELFDSVVGLEDFEVIAE